MGKTERILSYLPPIYRAYPQPWRYPRAPSLLYVVAGAAGSRLDEIDELLVEVMRAHWVDFADAGRDQIRDLALLADLFSLDPRDDEDVETFRLHLKRYVRAYLEGTATPRGILKLAAATLALSLEEALEPGPDDPAELLTVSRPGDDAALRLFGFREAEVRGVPPGPARLVGARDLGDGVDLRASSQLVIAVDGDNIAAVDVAGADPQATTPWEVARAINAALGIPVASHDSRRLFLTSGLVGADAAVQLGAPDGDAADALFGLAPRVYLGADARPARVAGQIDHAPLGGLPIVDLRGARYLRVALDGRMPVEVDCTGDDPAATTLDEVCTAINAALGVELASHDGHRLILTSPTVGPASRLELPPAPAEDARARLLGPAARLQTRGTAAAAAHFAGRRDLSQGLDLRQRHLLKLRIDGAPAVEIDCTGDQPDATMPNEIVTRINTALALPVASSDGRRITLTSPSGGSASRIEVLTPDDEAADASDLILGIAPRAVSGTLPERAVLRGQVALRDTLDLRRLRRLWLSIDGGPLLAIDCANPADPAHTSPQHVIDAINAALGTTIASLDDDRLVLRSPTTGAGSAIVLHAPEQRRRRPFYTRGRVREDAATMLFGFAAGRASGRLPEPARLTGTVDLSRGADLRVAHTLRIQLDDRDPREIMVANPARPMVTLLDYVVAAINGPQGFNAPVASIRDGRLELTSVVEGPAGRVALGVSSASDAGMQVLGLPPDSVAHGRAAERVVFVGMGDLARGLDISEHYLLRIGVDDRPLREIDLRVGLAPDAPPILSPPQLVAAINGALGGDYASHDGRRITISSQTTGSASRVTIEPAGLNDATMPVFGLSEPRSYQGQDATRARLVGTVDLSAGLQLGQRRHLSLEVDGELIADIDCARDSDFDKDDPGPTSLTDLIRRIERRKPGIVSQVDGRLVIISPSQGAGSSVALRVSYAADARTRLLGDAPLTALGKAGLPAELHGTVALSRPLDLSTRALITLQVDDGKPRAIDCAGEVPARTFSDEVLARINAVFPDLASLDAQGRLVLRAAQRVELLAQRAFTLFEFTASPEPRRSPTQDLRHGTSWEVVNPSVRAEPFSWELTSLSGVDRPRLTSSSGAAIWLNAVIPAGFTLRLSVDEEGAVHATATAPGRQPLNLADRVEARLAGQPASPPWAALPAAERARIIAAVLSLPAGSSSWQYTDCYGDRFNAAFYGRRRRRGRQPPLLVVPAHFAGGELCHAPGVFNQSRYARNQTEDPLHHTIFGSRSAAERPQASCVFVYRVHEAGRFELDLPADLPPQFGGRFNQARFAARVVGNASPGFTPRPEEQIVPNIVYENAIFDLPEDPQALDEQISARPNIVHARVILIPPEAIISGDEFPTYDGIPIYSVPFNLPRPLVGGGPAASARAFLVQAGVLGAVELRAYEPGAWGNAITVSAPESRTPGGFDITITYSGRAVFENARSKVQTQVTQARAAGVLGIVTRS